MRIWSLHPKYLDSKGLVALWRESLLAKKVLEGNTVGYTRHPQLHRFRKCGDPLSCINQYLAHVYHEAVRRDYNFNKGKVNWSFTPATLPVTEGQLRYEARHLLGKLKVRDPVRFTKYCKLTEYDPHPLFMAVEGEVEHWEKVKQQ